MNVRVSNLSTLLLFPALFIAEPMTAEAACSLTQYASLPVSYTASGLPEIQVVVNGQQASMLLDTQSAFSLIDTDIANTLHIKTQALPPSNVKFGKQQVHSFATVPLTLEHLAYPHMEMLVAHLPEASTVGAAGVLGLDVFAGPDIDTEFDFGHNRIALFSSKHCKGMGPYWADRYAMVPLHRGDVHEYYFDMTLDGKKLETMLATGATEAALFTNVSKQLYGIDEYSTGIQIETDGPGSSSRYYRAMVLSTEGVEVLNARVRLLTGGGCYEHDNLTTDRDGAAAFANCRGTHPFELGLGILKKLRLYFAAAEGTLFITAADAQR